VEYGTNLQLEITWDDFNSSTVIWPGNQEHAGGSGNPQIDSNQQFNWLLTPAVESETPVYDPPDVGAKQQAGDGNAVSVILIERVFSENAILRQLAGNDVGGKNTQFVATFTIRNDPNIFLADNSDRNINSDKSIDDDDVDFRSTLNQVQFQLLTEFGTIAPGEDRTEFVAPTVFVGAEERLTPPQIRTTPPRAAVQVEAAPPIESVVAEEGRRVILVKVNPDGSEEFLSELSPESLKDFEELFEQFRRGRLENGTYRIWLEEEGAPRRLIREFAKSGDSFGEVIRPPGRGSNKIPEGEDVEAATPEPDDGAVRSETDRIDQAFERFGAAARDASRRAVDPADIDAEETRGKSQGEPNAVPEAGDVSTATRLSELADSLVWRPHVNFAWVTLVAFGLAARASRRRWDQEVDRALEESEDRLSRRAARWLSRLRNRTPH
jgi:hypothetical protein